MDEKILHAAFIPFGEIIDVQIPLDYESEKHRGFAFIEFEAAEDAADAIDNMVIIQTILIDNTFTIPISLIFYNFHYRTIQSCLEELSELT